MALDGRLGVESIARGPRAVPSRADETLGASTSSPRSVDETPQSDDIARGRLQLLTSGRKRRAAIVFDRQRKAPANGDALPVAAFTMTVGPSPRVVAETSSSADERTSVELRGKKARMGAIY